MRIQKLTSTDAFIAFDLDDADGYGVTRLAKKVLVDGAELLARSTTYAFATFGIRRGGASAGINAEDDGKAAAIAAFNGEVIDLVTAGTWATSPGVGVTDDDLAPLRDADPTLSTAWADGAAVELTARGAAAAAGAARDGGLAGATVAIVGAGPVVSAVRAAAEADGASITEGTLDAPVDVVFLAGRAGMVDHEVAATVQATTIVPLTAVPITARAHAVLTKAGRVHVPDFIATAAPLIAAYGDPGVDPVAEVGSKVASLRSRPEGLWMAAATDAEAFLASWRDQLPFGRPLA